MEKVSTLYQLEYKDIQPNFECSSIRIEAYNLDSEKVEIHFISFLELAQLISPHGKGSVIVGIPFLSEDKDTGRSTDYKEIPITISELLTEIFDTDDKEFQMLESMKSEYKTEVYNCIIDMLERRFTIKHNCVTC